MIKKKLLKSSVAIFLLLLIGIWFYQSKVNTFAFVNDPGNNKPIDPNWNQYLDYEAIGVVTSTGSEGLPNEFFNVKIINASHPAVGQTFKFYNQDDIVGGYIYLDIDTEVYYDGYAGPTGKWEVYVPADDVAPVLDTEQYIYVTNVNSPTTIQNMMLTVNLTAHDDIDGNITNRIQIVSDGGYVDNVITPATKSRILGDYAINFSVADNAGNIATATVTIRVVDSTPPSYDSELSTLIYNVGYNSPAVTNQAILDGIIATDNFSSVTKTIIENNYTGNAGVVGSYTVKIKLEDTSSNNSTVAVTIQVYDNVKPVFTGATSFYKSYDVPKSVNDILIFCEIKVIDEYDGDLTASIVIIEDTYTGSSATPGEYTINLKATDNRGNFETHIITVTIGDDVLPYFLINKTKVIIEAGIEMTGQGLIMMLKDVGVVENKSLSYTVVKDTYTDNASIPGDYSYDLKVLYDDGVEDIINLDIQVLESFDTGEQIDGPKWYENVWKIIKDMFKWIGNAFKATWDWLINLLKKEILSYIFRG